MKYERFEIRNFKGIKRVVFNLQSKPHSTIYPLVGLNESGKTTVLEALDFFHRGLNRNEGDNTRVLNPGIKTSDTHDFIPMSERAMFTGKVSVRANVSMSPEDRGKLSGFLGANYQISDVVIKPSFTVDVYHEFSEGECISRSTPTSWGISIVGRRLLPGRNNRVKVDISFEDAATKPIWHACVGQLKTQLPALLYYPNFLFDFPGKIYLEEKLDPNDPFTDSQDAKGFYRSVLQDILDSMDNGATVENHILKRAKSDQKADGKALDSLLQQIDMYMSREIFGRWEEILGHSIKNRYVVTKWDVDDDGLTYLSIGIKDGNQMYEISERSLGFRWFFCFLMFTRYRGHRKAGPANAIILLDEPASNLHPSAQQQLLRSFNKIDNCEIIYTTHSHHMINPAWLESTYIVRNAGIDYQEEDDYNIQKADIQIEKYREFATKHPDQTTYFQPILDVLNYKVSQLENIPDAVLVEGKNDFYSLLYCQEKLGLTPRVGMMPGVGSGSLETVIRLYIGWNRRFIVLLDSDAAGRKEMGRYLELFGPIVQGRLFTLQDIDPTWTSGSMEMLFDGTDKIALQQMAYPEDTKYHKDHFNRAIQEAYLTDKIIAPTTATVANFEKILKFCAKKFESKESS